MIRTTNVKAGYIDTIEVKYVDEATYRRWTRRLVPERNDVVLTREAPLGEAGKIRTDERLFLGQRLYHFRPDAQRLDADFLLYSLMAPYLQAQIRALGSGSTVEHMRLSDIPSLEIAAPHIAEQRRIGSILSTYDDLIENCQRRIRILEDMARGLYCEWFVNFRFPGAALARAESRIGPVPKGWTVQRLADVAVINAEQISGRDAPEEIAYIDIASVSPGRISEPARLRFHDAPGRARRSVKHGDVLWSCVRPNRRSHALVLNPDRNTVASTGFAVLTARTVPFTYLYQATTTDEFVAYLTNHATGAAYPAVTASTFEDARVCVPDADTLNRYAEATIPMANQCALLSARCNNLRRTRDLLLPRLMSGQIDLRTAETTMPS